MDEITEGLSYYWNFYTCKYPHEDLEENDTIGGKYRKRSEKGKS
ncbi:hypothetical protein [Acinetobacter chinensis]|nr:hypothetical protein [Acinetobacter chinensis]WOE42066.1 hypothetical protein QSG87_02655 [Acinetobacter chinensis]